MKKNLLLISLALLTTVAHADWTRVEQASSELTLYVDHESRKDTGYGSTLMWYLLDYAALQDYQGKPFHSVKGQDEYDCTKGVRRDLLHFWHQDGMGNSRMMQAEYTPGPWIAPAEGSVHQVLLQIACAKK